METDFSIDITNTLTKFKEYFEHSERMILSAKFGDGKSYLLNKFMDVDDPKNPKYYFVVLHPVNYVVEENRDIFEYIKRDIIFQMLQDEKLFNFEDDLDILDKAIKENVSWEEVYDFLISLQPFTSLKTIGSLVKYISNKVKNIRNSVEREQNKPYDYVNSFAFHTGNFAECDGFTQLIQKALQHIEEQYKRKTVLIIEDMDRLDPGHLFRILNVLGAQIDNPYFESDRQEEGERNPNKFGFSKIVLVMDYRTSEHIFHHFYGKEADYEGYMQKFLDVNPFNFSLRAEAQGMLREKIKDDCIVYDEFFETKLKACRENDYVPSIMDYISRLSVRRCKQIIIKNINNHIRLDDNSSKFSRTLRVIAFIKLIAYADITLHQIYNSFTEEIASNIDIMFPVLRTAEGSTVNNYNIKLGNSYLYYEYDERTQKSSQKHTNYVQNPLNIKELQQIWRNEESKVLKYIDFT